MLIVFPVVKLWAYRERWVELEASDNPFATVVMAHLHNHATHRHSQQRLDGKLQLVSRLYERGYARNDVLELFRFLDWVLTLPPALEARWRRDQHRGQNGGDGMVLWQEPPRI